MLFDETNLDGMNLTDDYCIICFDSPSPLVGDSVKIGSYIDGRQDKNGFIWCIDNRIAYIKPFVSA